MSYLVNEEQLNNEFRMMINDFRLQNLRKVNSLQSQLAVSQFDNGTI